LIGEWGPIDHCCHLTGAHANPICTDDVAEKLNSVLIELAFLIVGVQWILPQLVKHRSDMLIMLLFAVAVDQNVVNEYDDELFMGRGYLLRIVILLSAR
jgi:hypothetical protein